jgi:hypothetical protein
MRINIRDARGALPQSASYLDRYGDEGVPQTH